LQANITATLVAYLLSPSVLQFMHTFRMHAVIQSRMQTISLIGSCRELQWNMQSKSTTACNAADH